MKPGDMVLVELDPHRHGAMIRRAVPRVCEVLLIDEPWAEVRAPGPANAAAESYLVRTSECRVIALAGPTTS